MTGGHRATCGASRASVGGCGARTGRPRRHGCTRKAPAPGRLERPLKSFRFGSTSSRHVGPAAICEFKTLVHGKSPRATMFDRATDAVLALAP
eukprot:1657454-Prymnesium_polylepis.1